VQLLLRAVVSPNACNAQHDGPEKGAVVTMYSYILDCWEVFEQYEALLDKSRTGAFAAAGRNDTKRAVSGLLCQQHTSHT
jgi:hypothetical protein